MKTLKYLFCSFFSLLLLSATPILTSCMYPDDDYEPYIPAVIPEITGLSYTVLENGSVELEAECTNLAEAEIEEAYIQYTVYKRQDKFENYTSLKAEITDTSLKAVTRSLNGYTTYWFRVQIKLKGGYVVEEYYSGTLDL